MSSLLEGLMGQLGGGALDGLGRQLGTDRKQTEGGLAAALPMLLGALSRNAESDDGARALDAALERDHDGGILDDAAGFFGRGDAAPGAAILKHVLGGKQQRMQNGLSQATGMNSEASGNMLAMLAPMVLGALGKQKREQGLDAGALAGLLGGERKSMERAAPQQFGIANMLLDADGDGDVDLSDVLQKGGGLLGKFFG